MITAFEWSGAGERPAHRFDAPAFEITPKNPILKETFLVRGFCSKTLLDVSCSVDRPPKREFRRHLSGHFFVDAEFAGLLDSDLRYEIQHLVIGIGAVRGRQRTPSAVVGFDGKNDRHVAGVALALKPVVFHDRHFICRILSAGFDAVHLVFLEFVVVGIASLLKAGERIYQRVVFIEFHGSFYFDSSLKQARGIQVRSVLGMKESEHAGRNGGLNGKSKNHETIKISIGGFGAADRFYRLFLHQLKPQ